MTNVLPKIDIVFSSAWWQANYKAELAQGAKRERLLFERFGDVGLGQADPPEPTPIVGDEYGDRFMAAFWGCEIVYQDDQAPSAIPLANPSERMENLQVPDVATSPVARKALDQAKQIKQKHDKCDTGIGFGGPMNIAISVFGDELLFVIGDNPELARDVLHKMAESIIAVHDQVYCPITDTDVSQARKVGWGVGNCPVCMISPQTYADVVRPADMWLKEQFGEGFCIHHCGQFHPYVDVYKPFEPTMLDVGPGSDLRITRRAYPDAIISTFIEVAELATMSCDQLDAQVARLIEDVTVDGASRELFTRIRVADAGPDISDNRVREYMTVLHRLGLDG